MNKEKKNIIIEKINNIFVNDFNTIKKSQEQINDYLKILNIIDSYNYNNFCVDFIKVSNIILENLTEEEFNKTPIDYFISGIISEMVKLKINNSNLDENQKKLSLMKLELDKYLYKNNDYNNK